MKFAFKPVTRALESKLGVPAFDVEVNGERHGVIVVKNQLDELIGMILGHEGIDLRTNQESAATVTELYALVPDMGAIATRVRDHAEVTELQGNSFMGCTVCKDKIHGNINTAFGAVREVHSFASSLYTTSVACEAGLPADIGIGILQQALAFGLQLNDPPCGRGAGMRTGIFVISLG